MALIPVVIVSSLVLAPPALASCTTEKQIFVQSTASPSHTNGTTNEILLKNRNLDPNCGTGSAFCTDPITMSLSTAHISRSTTPTLSGDWVEIGWFEYRTGAGDDWQLFTEKGLNGDMTKCFQTPAPNLEVGTYDRWRITGTHKADHTVDWDLQVNFLIGEGYATIKTYNTGWGENSAVALGETEARASESNMRDDQRNLQFKNDPGSWVDWPNVDCIKDTASDFQWNRISDNAYTVQGSGDLC